MTDTREYLRRVQEALYDCERFLEEPFCKEFSTLPYDDQVAFGRALVFAGCKEIHIPAHADGLIVPQEKRVHAARLMLLLLCLATGEPRWSSWLIDGMWEAVLAIPGRQFSDLFQAVFEMLAEFAYELTQLTASFILSLTHNGRIQFFTEY
jgi:hypothetical protein